MDSQHERTGNRAVNFGLGANVLLAVLKTVFGVVGHSEALLADGINSTSDVVYYVIVKVFVVLARKPPDREHPYGHRQLETIAALTVGAFVITTAIALFWGAVNNVYDILKTGGDSLPVGQAAFWVALLTVAGKTFLAVYTRRVASKTGNVAILALARDHRNDIFSAVGATVGLLASRCGWRWGDPLVGAVVALVVLCTGIQILRESAVDLMDAVPGEPLERRVREVLQVVPGLQAVEEVHAHRFGPYILLHVTVGIDGAMTVARGDAIASEVESALCRQIAFVIRVYVHYHPATASGGQCGGAPRMKPAREGTDDAVRSPT